MKPTQAPPERNTQYSQISALIRDAIEANGGWIGFEQYMQMALYTPGLGYYSGALAKFGEAGDFITAPETGNLFARCLASQAGEVLEGLGGGSILEFGAGSGRLAAELLNELARLDRLPEEYLVLELSGELRARQQATIEANAGPHLSRVRWLDGLPAGVQGVVFANEVLDAMPVRVFEQDAGGQVSELGVALEAGAETAFRWQARAADAELESMVRALGIHIDGERYRSEIGVQARAWIASLGRVLERGVVFLIDYGFPRREYYHPDRDRGTLMCHYRHRSHDDPFFMPGEQDITAHVDFSAIAAAGLEAGFEAAGYASQGAFLLSTGLLEKIPLDADMQTQLALAQEVKKLTLPHEMGELFKVLALTRAYPQPLCGFTQQNLINRLQDQ